jgi:hypothetical protein
MPLKPGVIAEQCSTPEQAKAEIERLMSGIDGFENCTVHEVTRVTEGWEALIDDPANDFEYDMFWIADDGGIEWS